MPLCALPAESQIATRPLTWATLTQLEPRLLALERALLAGPPPRGRRLWAQYEAAKGRLRPLVGWFARSEHEAVCSSEGYELAIVRIVAVLERPRRQRRRAA